MSWRALTEDDILTGFSGAESSAYRSKLLASGQADPLAGIITQVTGEIRGAIRTCGLNTLDDDAATLPASAIYHAIAIVRYRLQTRLVGGVTDERKAEWDAARQWMRDVAACRYRPEPPDADPEAPAVERKPRIKTPARTHDRNSADGI